MSAASEDLIRQELEKAASLISGARRLMSEGRQVDLSAMEERIRAVTEAVDAVSPEVANGYKDHLHALMDALDVLEQDLQTHHKALEEGLSTIRHREAEIAYGPKKT